jgi:hypothetical protein
MRHIVLGFLIFVALPATAEAPTAQMRYMCKDSQLIVQILVQEAGLYTVVLPSAVCGPSV